jgi:protein-S-isoprenylcysteine O-methyltransferase Ste14
MLFVRALASFLALPGIVAGLLPWLIVTNDPGRGDGWYLPGLVLSGAGLAVLLWCVRDFYVTGKGTLAPWDPPKTLVRVGLYRFVRNPMYVGVITLVTGWSLLSGSRHLAVYAVALMALFHARVVLFEEPWLARTFPDAWALYRASVPRWIPGLNRETPAAKRGAPR